MSRKPPRFDKKCVQVARLANQDSVRAFMFAASYPDGSYATTLADRSGDEDRYFDGMALLVRRYAEGTDEDIKEVLDEIATRARDSESEEPEDSQGKTTARSENPERQATRPARNGGGG